MQTEKLFYQDAYLKSFPARVISCEQDRDGWRVVLDRTAFYPEGGGQPGDQGFLNGIPVKDTWEREETVCHLTEQPLAPGTEVRGEIDWDRRFDLMQQHSGEHMVSGLVHSRYGYDNVGFHMGADVITIDFSGVLTEAQLREVEAEVNRRIWLDSPVRCWVPEPEALRDLPYRSKKELTGDVRLVEFPDTDLCACCGTHVARTGEIGLVKLLTVEKFHQGVRVEMLAGKRAYDYLCRVQTQNRQISQMLSAKVEQTAQAVELLAGEAEAQKQRAYGLEMAWFRDKAESLRDRGDVLVQMEGLSADGVRRAAAAIQETCGGRAAVFSGDDQNGYKYAVGLPGGDLRDWVRGMNEALHGRGGGKPGFVQGSVRCAWKEILAFFEAAE